MHVRRRLTPNTSYFISVLLASTLGIRSCHILDARQRYHWTTTLLD